MNGLWREWVEAVCSSRANHINVNAEITLFFSLVYTPQRLQTRSLLLALVQCFFHLTRHCGYLQYDEKSVHHGPPFPPSIQQPILLVVPIDPILLHFLSLLLRLLLRRYQILFFLPILYFPFLLCPM
jgi:hypothetical protein